MILVAVIIFTQKPVLFSSTKVVDVNLYCNQTTDFVAKCMLFSIFSIFGFLHFYFCFFLPLFFFFFFFFCCCYFYSSHYFSLSAMQRYGSMRCGHECWNSGKPRKKPPGYYRFMTTLSPGLR